MPKFFPMLEFLFSLASIVQTLLCLKLEIGRRLLPPKSNSQRHKPTIPKRVLLKLRQRQVLPVRPRQGLIYAFSDRVSFPSFLIYSINRASSIPARQLVESPAWAPSFKNAFRIIFAVRCAAGLYSIITDCDEVFNYWEPTHWLQYGFGLQTWEYSPEFTIRSWSYISVHALFGWIGSLVAKSKVSY
jgi:hypothetical protein